MISPLLFIVIPIAFLFSMLSAFPAEGNTEKFLLSCLIALKSVLLAFVALFSSLFLFILTMKTWDTLNDYLILNNKTPIAGKDFVQILKKEMLLKTKREEKDFSEEACHSKLYKINLIKHKYNVK